MTGVEDRSRCTIALEENLLQRNSSWSGFRRFSAERTWPDMPLTLSLRSVLVLEPFDGAALAVRCEGVLFDMSVWVEVLVVSVYRWSATS
jgi:hypothetical protein